MERSQFIFIGLAILTLLYLSSNNTVEGFYSYRPCRCNLNTRYGLRGDILRISDIRNKYIYPTSHFRLNSSSGTYYESKFPPHPREGECKNVECPAIFDHKDGVCWYCKQ